MQANLQNGDENDMKMKTDKQIAWSEQKMKGKVYEKIW